jgi:GNAT superfamily N-acetyltransferase
VRLHIEPSLAGDIESARALFVDAWARERENSPDLPVLPLGSDQALRLRLEGCAKAPGVAAYSGGDLVGYLCECARFVWKGQRVALCREHAHAAAGALSRWDRRRVYQEMYAELAKTWVAAGVHLHIVCHFAGDTGLTDTLFGLGFGAILAENLRDMSPVPAGVRDGGEACVALLQDPGEMHAIVREHKRYYRESPIFLPKDDSAQAVQADIDELGHPDDACFVCRVDGKPVAYFVVGECTGKDEGSLLGGTNTAQAKSAYAVPEYRGRGVGRHLLARSVAWATERGFDRLFVEHETANIQGSAFWQAHFAPYLFVSMRYVDSTVGGGRASRRE